MAMAVLWRGMGEAETVALTRAMTPPGEALILVRRWFARPGAGQTFHRRAGDKVSLMLAPIVAACGGFVPMISGRGPGHTGGTLDKWKAIARLPAPPERLRRAARGRLRHRRRQRARIWRRPTAGSTPSAT